MFAWIVGAGAAVLALGVVVAALLLEGPAPRHHPGRPGRAVPTSRELRDARFRLRWRGYDPYEVDIVLAAAADALDALAAEAGADAAERAQRRLRTARGGSALGEELEDGGGDGSGVLDR